ncbi:hypothetical protein PP187_gp097 [Klebsiella phage vB_KvM-Eowyn]|uniref:Uncharacterized protein n=1 Tax=Klebsiella phage vB_KvM-Eowyn TaxID=2762819 RepID=A0A7R8R5U7_9CAUD|nr:hypothetical protein PP187_gp097 [Klebsiella phage vB_KvM-Eowyn]CAD5236086.1 hypothetical protein LLCLJKAH_00097 [Klebsiella phage vB_KvM-Eowyn]
MRVLNFFLTHTGTHSDAMLRSYDVSVSQQNIDAVRETTLRGAVTDMRTIAMGVTEIASSVMRQKTTPDAVVSIPNGMGEQRLRFYLEIETDRTSLTVNRQIITGFTDHLGYHDHMGRVSIDPNMQYYPNNIICLRDQITFDHTRGINTTTTVVSDSSQILRGDCLVVNPGVVQPPVHDVWGHQTPVRPIVAGTVNANDVYAVRPQDVFRHKAATEMVRQHGGGATTDKRLSFMDGVRKSHRDNANGTRYLAKTLAAMNQAYTMDDADSNYITTLYNQAGGLIGEATIAQDRFLGMLNSGGGFTQRGFFTHQELLNHVPDAENIAVIIKPTTPTEINELCNRGNTDGWGGGDWETLIATRLSSATPGIMMESSISRIWFEGTNMTHNGRFQINIMPDHFAMMTQVADVESMITRFKINMETQVLPGMLPNSQMPVTVTAVMDWAGESRIWVSVDGRPPVPFEHANFCDGLSSPVICANPEAASHISNDLVNLAELARLPYHNAMGN